MNGAVTPALMGKYKRMCDGRDVPFAVFHSKSRCLQTFSADCAPPLGQQSWISEATNFQLRCEMLSSSGALSTLVNVSSLSSQLWIIMASLTPTSILFGLALSAWRLYRLLMLCI